MTLKQLLRDLSRYRLPTLLFSLTGKFLLQGPSSASITFCTPSLWLHLSSTGGPTLWHSLETACRVPSSSCFCPEIPGPPSLLLPSSGVQAPPHCCLLCLQPTQQMHAYAWGEDPQACFSLGWDMFHIFTDLQGWRSFEFGDHCLCFTESTLKEKLSPHTTKKKSSRPWLQLPQTGLWGSTDTSVT